MPAVTLQAAVERGRGLHSPSERRVGRQVELLVGHHLCSPRQQGLLLRLVASLSQGLVNAGDSGVGLGRDSSGPGSIEGPQHGVDTHLGDPGIRPAERQGDEARPVATRGGRHRRDDHQLAARADEVAGSQHVAAQLAVGDAGGPLGDVLRLQQQHLAVQVLARIDLLTLQWRRRRHASVGTVDRPPRQRIPDGRHQRGHRDRQDHDPVAAYCAEDGRRQPQRQRLNAVGLHRLTHLAPPGHSPDPSR